MKVRKYLLNFAPEGPESTEGVETEVELPVGSQILTVELSMSGPALFVLVDDDAPDETRTFVVIDNKIELPEGVNALHYRGTCKIPGAHTFHVFETTQVEAAA